LPKYEARRGAALAHYGELARLGKAFASPARLQLLDLLRQGPRSVEDLADAAGLTIANASRHLQQMRAARVVDGVRDGRHIRYRLAGEDVSRAYEELRRLAEAHLPELDRVGRELDVLAPAARGELLARVRRGEVTLLDVRPAEEFRAGHLPGSRSIPLAELPARLAEIPRGREVVAYCRGPYCPMAVEAVHVLVAAGFRARHLDLGVPDLRALGFTVATGDGAPPTRARRGGATSRSAPRTPTRRAR
jgi:rhodanese-related sulfurtransferase/DNA-binding transcriptional ArsR family regulator